MQNLNTKNNLLKKEATYIEKDQTLEPEAIQDKLSEIKEALKLLKRKLKA